MVLTSSRRFSFVPSPPPFVQGFPSTINGDGCSGFSAPTRALVESLLLVRPPFVDTEHVVSLLSVDEGDVIRLGRALERLCRLALASLRLFLCCGTLDGLGLVATLALRALPLRTDLIVLRVAEPAPGGEGKPWFSRSMDPGSSTGRVGDGKDAERGRLGRGLCISAGADLGHMDALSAGERIMSLTTASRLDAELTRAELWRADAGVRHV